MNISFHTSKIRGDRGFNLVEIVVATGIISLSLVSIIAIAGRSLAVSHRSLNTYQASILLEEGAEAVRIVRDSGWGGIAGLTAGLTYYPAFDSSLDEWSLSTTSSDGEVGQFMRSVEVADVSRDASTDDIDPSGSTDTGTRKFTVNVSWRESNGATVTKSLPFYLTDIF
jgi:Tfp pilus assembly protein PilV